MSRTVCLVIICVALTVRLCGKGSRSFCCFGSVLMSTFLFTHKYIIGTDYCPGRRFDGDVDDDGDDDVDDATTKPVAEGVSTVRCHKQFQCARETCEMCNKSSAQPLDCRNVVLC